jgi:cell division protein ZapB
MSGGPGLGIGDWGKAGDRLAITRRAGGDANPESRIPNPAFNAIFEPMPAPEQSLLSIDDRLDRLIALCRSLQEENRSLRHSQEQLASERSQLLARNEQARSRVEAMILRLKSLEQNPA